MENGTASAPNGFCSRRWGSSLDLFDRFLGTDEPNTAVGPVAKRLYHRAAAPTQRDPCIALRSRLPSSLRNGNRISIVIDECNVAMHSVRSVLPNLDPDVCHFCNLGSGTIAQSPMTLRLVTGLLQITSRHCSEAGRDSTDRRTPAVGRPSLPVPSGECSEERRWMRSCACSPK